MRRPVVSNAHLLVEGLHQGYFAVLVVGPEVGLETSQRWILESLGQPVEQIHRLGKKCDIVAPEGQPRPGSVQVDLDKASVVITACQVEQGLGHEAVRLGSVTESGGIQSSELVGHPLQ